MNEFLAAAAPTTGTVFAAHGRSYYGSSVACRVVSYSKVQNLSDAKIFLASFATLLSLRRGRVLSFGGPPVPFAALDAATCAAILMTAPAVLAVTKTRVANRADPLNAQEFHRFDVLGDCR